MPSHHTDGKRTGARPSGRITVQTPASVLFTTTVRLLMRPEGRAPRQCQVARRTPANGQVRGIWVRGIRAPNQNSHSPDCHSPDL